MENYKNICNFILEWKCYTFLIKIYTFTVNEIIEEVKFYK